MNELRQPPDFVFLHLCHTHSLWKCVEVNPLTDRVPVLVIKSLSRV